MTESLVKQTSMQDSTIKAIGQKRLLNGVSIISFTDEKIVIVTTSKTHRMTNCMHIHKSRIEIEIEQGLTSQ